MYSRKAWGGAIDPFILVKFLANTVPDGSDPIVSLVIFEWKDEPLIGIYPTADSIQVLADQLGCCATANFHLRRNIFVTRKT